MALVQPPSPQATGSASRGGGLWEFHFTEPSQAERWLAVMPLRLILLASFLILLQVNSLGARAEEPESSLGLARLGWLMLGTGVSLGWLLMARRIGNIRPAIYVQIGLDIAIDAVSCSALITGAVDSFLVVLPFTTIIGASWTLSTRAGIGTAMIMAASLFLLSHVQTLSEIIGSPHPPLRQSLTQLLGLCTALPLVGLLVGRLRRELYETTVLYDEILMNLSHGILALDSQYRVILINERARQFFALEARSNPVGQKAESVLNREREKRMLDILLEPDVEQGEMEVEIDGKTRLIDIKKSILLDERDQIRAIVGVFIDVTLEKKTQEAEARAQSLDGIAEIALGFAHEVRNPLTTIRGCIQELVTMDPSEPAFKRLASLTEREADRVERLLNEFVDLSRLKQRFPHTFDLRDLIEDTVVRLRHLDVKGSASIEVEDLAEPTEAARIYGDDELLLRALLNIGRNGLEAMEGQGRLKFIIKNHSVPRRRSSSRSSTLRILRGYRIAVEDTGPGIPPDKVQQIFTPFYTTKEQGMGLGLALALKIIRSFHGEIEVENIPEGGARFLIWLPQAPAPKEGETALPASAAERT